MMMNWVDNYYHQDSHHTCSNNNNRSSSSDVFVGSFSSSPTMLMNRSDGGELINPNTSKGNNTMSKSSPVRRRSRSSRKTPTTLLSADINNFRTLVQQYTGCRLANNNSSFFRRVNHHHKGPINLNFAEASEDNDDVVINTIPMGSSGGSSSTSVGRQGYNGNYKNDPLQVHSYYHQEGERSSSVLPGDYRPTMFTSGGGIIIKRDNNEDDGGLNSKVMSDNSSGMLSVDDYHVQENTCLSW